MSVPVRKLQDASPRLKRRRRRLMRLVWLWVALIVVLGFGVNVYLALRPAALEARVRTELANALDMDVNFESLDVTLGGEISLNGFWCRQAPDSPLLDVNALRAQLRLLPILWGQLRLKEILIDGPVCHVSREADGSWNLAQLFGGRDDGLTERTDIPVIVIVGGRVVYSDPISFESAVEEEITDVNVSVFAGDREDTRFELEMRLPGAHRVEAHGRLSVVDSRLRLRVGSLNLRKLDLKAVQRFLPKEVAAQLTGLKLTGTADISSDFLYDSEAGLGPVRVACRVLRGDIEHPQMPFALRGLQGNIALTDGLLKVERLAGRWGGGGFAFDGDAEFDFATGSLQRWSLSTNAESFPLDSRLRAALPPDVREIYDDFMPAGRVGLRIRVTDVLSFPPPIDKVNAILALHDVDLAYVRFPYLVRGLKGEVAIENGRLRFPQPIEAHNGETVVTVAGDGATLNANGELDIVIRGTGVVLDERVRESLPVSSRPIWDDFHPVGKADALVHIFREPIPPDLLQEKRDERSTPQVMVVATPRDARIAYQHFPYEVTGITGEVRLDFSKLLMTFVGLKGKHGKYTIRGNGAVQLSDDHLFQLKLDTDFLTIDEDLAAAMSANARQLLEDFRLQGDLALEVNIQTVDSGDLSVTTDVEVHRARVKHKRFPYELNMAGGHARLIGDHTARFRDVHTVPDSTPEVLFNGGLTTKGTRQTLDFDFELNGVRFDEELVAALLPQLRHFVEGVGLGGTYRGRVDGSFELDTADPDYIKIIYAGRDVVVDEGEVDFGLRIDNIAANGQFVGSRLPDRKHQLMGQVTLESGWFNMIHLRDTVIDFALGHEHSAIAAARGGESISNRSYTPPPRFLDRLTEDQVEETFQALLHSKNLYGGNVDGFLYVETGEQQDIAGDFVADSIQVAEAAEDVFGAAGAGTKGVAQGYVKFSGRTGSERSVVGEGKGEIVEARLVQLPLFLDLLAVLTGNPIGAQFFNEVLAVYEIKNGRFVAKSDGLRLNSPGIKLRGGGTMDFQGKLDLVFLPRIFNAEVVVLEQILDLLKKSLVEIRIAGNLKEPEIQLAPGHGVLRIPIDSGGSDKSKERLPTDLRKSSR